MKILGKMQKRAAIWILGAFKTLPMEGIEAITGVIPIKFHLQKLASKSQLCSLVLPASHLIRILMDDPPTHPLNPFLILSICSQIVRGPSSKIIQSTQTTSCMGFFLHFHLFIWIHLRDSVVAVKQTKLQTWSLLEQA